MKNNETSNTTRKPGRPKGSTAKVTRTPRHSKTRVAADLTPDEKLAAELRIKPRTKAFYDLLLANPSMSQVEAWLKTHDTESRKSARTTASQQLAKPSASIYMDNAVDKAKKKVVKLINSQNEDIALKASKDVLDRTYGRATQKQETTQKTIEVKLDLTGVKLGAHYLSQSPVQPSQTVPETEEL